MVRSARTGYWLISRMAEKKKKPTAAAPHQGHGPGRLEGISHTYAILCLMVLACHMTYIYIYDAQIQMRLSFNSPFYFYFVAVRIRLEKRFIHCD